MSEAPFFPTMRDKSSEKERGRNRDASERGDLVEFLKNDTESGQKSPENQKQKPQGAAKK